MPDLMDAVQDAILANTDDAIAARRAPREGLDACEDCGEPISDVRRALGARLCLEHQADAERRARARR